MLSINKTGNILQVGVINRKMNETSTAKSAKKIMFAVMGSRVLGLVREMVLNAVFGAGKYLDAFYVAFRLPNLLRDLFAEGALSVSFVTTFSKKMETEGKPAAFRLASLVISSLCLIIGAITLVGIFGSEWLVHLIASGFYHEPGKAELTVQLTRILFPFIFFVSLAAVYMGLLNSLGSFGLPASASTAFNAVSIISGLAIGWLIDPHLGWKAIYGFAIGTVLGGIVQLIIQVPRSIRFGFHFRWMLDWKDSGLRQVLILTLPAVIGGAAVQVNVLVNTWFASYLENGTVTCLNNAFRLMQLPIGMFGVAIASVVLPAVSRSAAQTNMEHFREKISEGIKLALFLTIPASVGLAVLAKPIIAIIYQRGAFTAFATAQTALALQAYTIGLASYACIKVLAPPFYALDLPKIPVRISMTGIAFNIILNYLFIRVLNLGIRGLALSTSIVALINVLQLAFELRSRLGVYGQMVSFFIRIILSSTIMGLVVYGLKIFLEPRFNHFWGQLSLLFITISAGIVIFACMSWILKMKEIQMLLPILRKR
jgi:putative peptidoglycan lipid II flippase